MTDSEIKDKVKALNARKKALSDERKATNNRQLNLTIEMNAFAKSVCPYKIGDIVSAEIWKGNRRNAQIGRIEYKSTKPYYKLYSDTGYHLTNVEEAKQ